MKPNVLLIHADQLRQDCLGAYGNSQVITPNIDALAKDGVLHTEHFTVFPVCTPSRYSMLCGQYPHRHLGFSNHSTLPFGIKTFPKILRENNWHTTAIGKMHFTPTYLDIGFENMILAEQDGDGRFEDDYHTWLMENGLHDDFDIIDQRGEYRRHANQEYFDGFGVQEYQLPDECHSTEWIHSRACEQIEKWDSSGGNMMMIGYIKPHHPFDPPKKYAELYNPDNIRLLEGYCDAVPEGDDRFRKGYFDNHSLTEVKLKKMIAFYYALITQIDDSVGAIVKLLKSKGLYDNTMIIFTSDHGDYMGYHHMALKGNQMYEPLMKIPLVIKYPAGESAGTVQTGLSSNIDLGGEILRVCGLDCHQYVGSDNGLKPREYVMAEQQVMRDGVLKNCFMLRTKQYKLLLEGAVQNCRLIDLKRDPMEFGDCSKDTAYAEILQKHLSLFTQCMAFDAPIHAYINEKEPVNMPENAPSEAKRSRASSFMKEKSSVGKLI